MNFVDGYSLFVLTSLRTVEQLNGEMLILIITFALWVLLFFCVMSKVIQKLTVGRCKSFRCLMGKTAIVTGGNSGMGYETSLTLASRGCKVIIADVADSSKTVAKIIEETGNPNISYKHLDLGSLESVRKFAKEIHQQEHCLDILINNAGVGGFQVFDDDGLYKTMHINHLGPFLLTHLLIDLIKNSNQGRIVFASSLLAFTSFLSDAKKINAPVKAFLKYFSIVGDYSNSKLCNSITTILLAEKLRKYNISVNCHHPGIVHTGIYNSTYEHFKKKNIFSAISRSFINFIVWIYGKTPNEGAQNNLHCALSKKLENNSGNFVADCINIIHPSRTKNKEFCQAVWEESEFLVNLTPEEKIY